MESTYIGQKYITFLNILKTGNFTKELELLFSPDIKKVVNSKLVCTDRAQLSKQMGDVVSTYGIKNVNLVELINSDDHKKNVIRFELTYNDNSTDSVISILTPDEHGLISEINEVAGEKHGHE